ncbi:aspartyl-phosphate phosphatase Spo0E family protein [Clostridium botulinum]|uniref:Aspartyl-phosphate phosphatase Spo0E family protein n=1 Tax=Clostridium botulinum TaxID=1491 RepID=A0A6B4P533_CLOBO|nr:aspartyl-phosphate phosphatase Spo0E family protein [Clostridium botulinum]KAI3350768.1 aspartyl-phosphate phosphatase Spo0E family protein [Clostridium botulinum]NFE58168.1 aspartyl-phosphate phosphatase Spo0E family protein [Clostridium botulinum]NFE94505.1 aspartyl-phosphate phosphatase Spo0E family protein [Clostridium botulinum]NFF87641.1 aspartyl-phosphate phosphatase Spo0E family protein [Clostridium botulinum]NFG11264.1 aspartyl-phosphate phosphatase Spo0E family protein [Clostridiu
MENLREELYKRILQYGTEDKRVLELSQKLDPHIVKEQKKI